MPKFKLHIAVVVLACAAVLAFADMASAAKKQAKQPTFEEAWARCKVQVDKLPTDAHGQRYTRGAACMQMFGYRI